MEGGSWTLDILNKKCIKTLNCSGSQSSKGGNMTLLLTRNKEGPIPF
jgi:hypothetical protein